MWCFSDRKIDRVGNSLALWRVGIKYFNIVLIDRLVYLLLNICFVYYRQMVTRSLLETIRTIENEEEAEIFLKAISTLADDSGE